MAFLDARVLYANDDWKSAREGFEKVRPKLNDFPQLMKCLDYWIGYCYLQQGNPDQAMAAFRRALSFDKFYFKAHDGIAQIFIANGQIKDAVEEYRQAAGRQPRRCRSLAGLRQNARALEPPSQPRGAELGRGRAVLQQAETLNPRDGQIKLLLAEMLLARGQAEEAENLVEALREDSPKGVEFWIAQANLAARRGELAEARQILDEAASQAGRPGAHPPRPGPILLAGIGPAGRGRDREAGRRRRCLLPRGEDPPLERPVNNLLEIKEYDRAKRLCRQIARVQPHDAMIRYRLFELALVTHDARDPAARWRNSTACWRKSTPSPGKVRCGCTARRCG